MMGVIRFRVEGLSFSLVFYAWTVSVGCGDAVMDVLYHCVIEQFESLIGRAGYSCMRRSGGIRRAG
jgi:hypothetical protein